MKMDLTTEQRTARDTIISPIVDELFKIKVKSPNHKLARNVISNKVKVYKKSGIHWITSNVIRGRLKRKYQKYMKGIAQAPSNVSVPISPSNMNDDSPPPPGGLSLEECNTNSVDNNEEDKVSGRPIGTTLKRKAQVHALVVKATNEVTEMYNNAKMKYTDRGTISMVPNGTLHTIINRIKKHTKTCHPNSTSNMTW